MMVNLFKFLLKSAKFIQFSSYEMRESDCGVDYPVQHCHRISPHVEFMQVERQCFQSDDRQRSPSTTVSISFRGIDHSAVEHGIT